MEFPWLNPNTRVDRLLSGFNGTLYPFQHAGVAFLSSVRKGLLLDQPGLGKTLQTLAAFNLIRTQKSPRMKMIVVTLASTQLQWVREANHFFPDLKAVAAIGKQAQRFKIYESYHAEEIDILVIHYMQLIHDMELVNPDAFINIKCKGPLAEAVRKHNFWLVLDEIQKVKNVSAKISKSSLWMTERANAVKGLTATPIYNHLVDIYGIFKLIEPNVFTNKETFKREFCILDFTFSRFGKISGYKNHDKLRERIKYFTFGRTAEDAKHELPPIIPKVYNIELSKPHYDVYEKVLAGYSLETDLPEIALVGALQRAQVCVNNIEKLADYKNPRPSHPKLDEASRIVTEEFEGRKVVIFSKFEQSISILEQILKKERVRTFRITGKENQVERDHFQTKFNSPSEETTAMLITTAGGAGLNLQSACAIIFIDRPWSYGELVQIRGRIRRIGSVHQTLIEAHIVATGTIDEHVIELLGIKDDNVRKILGEGDRSIRPQELLERIKNGNRRPDKVSDQPLPEVQG